ncbi:F0F1 ATP synthase subunit alpha [Gammaproteobacteria bacterium Comchoano-2]|uniref:ATP synthase subunit alpha n=2 Tax=Candidatus Synchoanobacter obligatus TaxID=2919597 RepID=A0ABT1L627_9GAMM|nr:F0F1 ATP synthase subunit alpha [Candidatus Synchoanobacter obligatus]MCP8352185.1 F0F1 ATP synthase subunit alpha [Candidatus Synchoanobacter obligatus]
MTIETHNIASVIRSKLDNIQLDAKVSSKGTVITVNDGIAQIYGLTDVMYGEMLQFENNIIGVALNLETDSIGAIIFGDYSKIQEGQVVSGTKKILEVPIGPELAGRVVNPLGEPIDGDGPIDSKLFSPIEKIAPGVISRHAVNEPLQTGLKAIDAMTPIGRGQRELIIGDRQTGKTTIAIDTILNQANASKPIHCIYVAIGQKASTVAGIVKKLKDAGAMKYTTVVAANAADPAAMQYIAPYSGCSMGEYYRDNGLDALIVYDDLSKHAVAYRQISLLLNRPPGREAFPGDIFYLHSRLLERAARVSAAYVEEITEGTVSGKTGSLTALPIIETQAGDVSAFIPTNVISITDGQIFLDEGLFKSGIRPAIDSGLSVSRIGSAAQTAIIKKLGGQSRMALAQYRELAAFSQFSSDLDDATKKQLKHGEIVTEIFKQHQYQPLSVAEMAISMFVVELGLLDNVASSEVSRYERELQQYMTHHQKELIEAINQNPELSPHEKALSKALETFHDNSEWSPNG